MAYGFLDAYTCAAPARGEENVAEWTQLDDEIRGFRHLRRTDHFSGSRELFGAPLRLTGHHDLNGGPNSSTCRLQLIDLY
jgi:hypothetical protein